MPEPQQPGIIDKLKGFGRSYVQTLKDTYFPESNPALKQKPMPIQSLGALQDPSLKEHQDLEKIEAARQLKDPMQAPTNNLRIQALIGKLGRIYSSDDYQKLDTADKVYVKRHIYRQYVDPVYRANGINPPTEDEWLAGLPGPAAREDTRKPSNIGEVAMREATSGVAVTTKVAATFLDLISGQKTTPLDLSYWLYKNHKDPRGAKIGGLTNVMRELAETTEKTSQSYHSIWKPDHGTVQWLAGTAGRVAGEAPAFLIGGSVASMTKKGLVKAIPTLAERAATNKGFGLALAALENGGGSFTVDRMEGRNLKESLSDAAFNTLFDAGVRWGAAKLAVGGKLFHEKVSRGADKLDKEHGIDDNVPRKSELESAVSEDDAHFIAATKKEYAMREALARKLHPEKVAKAGDRGVWRQLSKGQRNKIRTLMDQQVEHAAENMPSVAPEMQTVANAHEQAINEINPQGHQLDKLIEQKFGVSPAAAVTKVQAEHVAKKKFKTSAERFLEKYGTLKDEPVKTGPREVEAGEEKETVRKQVAEYAKDKVKEGAGDMVEESTNNQDQQNEYEHEYEPKEGAYASLGVEPKISYFDKKSIPTSKLVKPDTPTDEFVAGTIKYTEKSPATASGHIFFENPEHHLLHVAVNSEAPSAVKNRAFKILQKEFKEPKHVAIRRAQWLQEHVEDLKATDRLNLEGNVFNSTKLVPRRYGTKWQHELHEELTDTQIRQLKLISKAHPELNVPDLLRSVNNLRNKTSRPEIAAKRREATEMLIQVLREYK